MTKLRITPLLLITVALIGIVIPVQAQERSKNARTKFDVVIPFDFIVGNRRMLAGSYRFESVLNSTDTMDILLVRGNESFVYQAITTALVTSPEKEEASRLTFKRYGDNSFLSGVWIRGRRTGLRLFTSILEKEVASAQLSPQDVTLAFTDDLTFASVKTAH